MPEAGVAEKVRDQLFRLRILEKSLKPGNLAERIAQGSRLGLAEVQMGLAELVRLGHLQGVTPKGFPARMVGWIGPRPPEPAGRVAWREALSGFESQLTAPERAQLEAGWESVASLDDADQARLIEGLIRLRALPADQDLYERSAQTLLGSAKAAKNLKPLLRALSIDADELGGEGYVITAGPPAPAAILFIENVRNFTAFKRSRHVHRGLGVITYGYGLAMESLGRRLNEGTVVCCPAVGERPDLRELINRLPCLFWGDHDLEGLRIYDAMRKAIPALRLSAAYALSDRLLDSTSSSHPYLELFEKQGQRPPAEPTPEAAYLLERCRMRCVDQEAVNARIDQIDVFQSYRMPSFR